MHLDFEDVDVRLQIELDEIGVEVPVDERLEDAVGVEAEGDAVEDFDGDEEEGDEDDDDATSQGHPLRLRRSDRANKGVPPVRFQAGGP